MAAPLLTMGIESKARLERKRKLDRVARVPLLHFLLFPPSPTVSQSYHPGCYTQNKSSGVRRKYRVFIRDVEYSAILSPNASHTRTGCKHGTGCNFSSHGRSVRRWKIKV